MVVPRFWNLAVIWLALALGLSPVVVGQAASPRAVVAAYNEALIDGDGQALKTTLGPQVSMFNGAGSTDLSNWQPHMYLSELDVAEWADFMVSSAGPHENSVRFITVEERANLSSKLPLNG